MNKTNSLHDEGREELVKQTILGMSILALAAGAALCAQQPGSTTIYNGNGPHRGSGQVITPMSAIQRPEDIGVRARTHYLIFIPERPSEQAILEAKAHPNAEPVAGYNAETPASLACLYGETTWTYGCNPATLANSAHATGGSKAIAIVDAYDYPTAQTDLAAYSTQFGLTAITSTNFTKVYATGTNPGPDPACAGGNGWNCWSSEEALDIEMVHAMAPSAHIYLVEAKSSSFTDLSTAWKKAASLLTTTPNTGGEISMSFGGGEFSGETSFDSTFTGTNVVYFASTGDHEGTEYPSVSPNVVAVGGTTLDRNGSNGNIEAETAWEDGGGGYSEFEAEPSYQDVIFGTGAGFKRAVPDVALEGNPRTGVWVYDSYETANLLGTANWLIFGGTSVASPLMAGVVNHAGHFYASTAAEEKVIYSNDELSPNFRDITYGTCGYYEGWFAVYGWDPCTGLGAPYGTAGK